VTLHAGHAVNDRLALDAESEAPIESEYDVARSVRNVESWGGDPALYLHFLSAAVRVDRQADFLTVSALSAWRAGVVDLRNDALRRLGDALVGEAAAGAALGVDPDGVEGFVRAQQADPFAWASGDQDPARPRLVARVGGFRGLGGPWSSPPRSPRSLGAGRFALDAGDEAWELSADVFGSHLVRMDGEAGSDPRETSSGDVRLVTSPTSYLAYLVRGAA
jgi:hypothetical protein